MTQQRNNIAHRRKRESLLTKALNSIAATMDAYTAGLDMKATELRHHISRIEAAAVDQFQLDMGNITDSPEARQELRNTALALGQLGIGGFEDVQKMVQGFYIMDIYGLSLWDIRKIGEIKVGGRRI